MESVDEKMKKIRKEMYRIRAESEARVAKGLKPFPTAEEKAFYKK